MLGAPLDGPVWAFGDNKSVIDSAASPAGRLTKFANMSLPQLSPTSTLTPKRTSVIALQNTSTQPPFGA